MRWAKRQRALFIGRAKVARRRDETISSCRNDGSSCPLRACREIRDGMACRLMKRIGMRVVTTACCTGVWRQRAVRKFWTCSNIAAYCSKALFTVLFNVLFTALFIIHCDVHCSLRCSLFPLISLSQSQWIQILLWRS
jgi:hypothetical protein